jgi:DNA-binding MarR family transcriptional regulator
MTEPARGGGVVVSLDRQAEPDLPDLLLKAVPRTMVVIRDVVRGFAPSDRTILHFRIVTLLLEQPRTTSELAELTGAAPANISKVVAPMGRGKLVTRRHDPQDRRYVHIALTAKGRAQAVAMLAAVRSEMTERLQPLGRSERKALADALLVLARAFDATRPTAAKVKQV